MAQNISTLEDVLLRNGRQGGIRERVIKRLDEIDHKALLNLRCASRPLRDLVDHHPGRLFPRLYIRTTLPTQKDLDTLAIVSRFAHTLTITVGSEETHVKSASRRIATESPTAPVEPETRKSWPRLSTELLKNAKRRLSVKLDKQKQQDSRRDSGYTSTTRDSWASNGSTSPTSPLSAHAQASTAPLQTPETVLQGREDAKQQWRNIFSRFRNLHTLILCVHGDPAWPGRTEVEDTLVAIRIALEHSDFPHLRTVCFIPIHVMGIMHLRWSGFGAFDETPAKAHRLWRNLHTLELRIKSPFGKKRKLSDTQKIMFMKVLQDYLRSFAPTLIRLRLIWLGGEGPSPLDLDLVDELQGQRPILWKELEELWVARIALPHRMIRVAEERAPNLVELKTLRSTELDSEINYKDERLWVDVLLGQARSAPAGFSERASSIYSRNASMALPHRPVMPSPPTNVPATLDLLPATVYQQPVKRKPIAGKHRA